MNFAIITNVVIKTIHCYYLRLGTLFRVWHFGHLSQIFFSLFICFFILHNKGGVYDQFDYTFIPGVLSVKEAIFRMSAVHNYALLGR